MSLFGTIMDKIFHHPAAAATAPAATAPAASASASSPVKAGAIPSAPASAAPVDVEAVLTAMAATHGGGGNWQTSIVDLLKLLELDSSLDARKGLANELKVHVGADGTADENIALHKAVMIKLAENGGKVPDSMK
ncbi:DUF3597 domain-containing protein (plasmid) [Polymorphobacter sp. PAMC 29334]|uniref:DUF3597 domain-containing protein n=1 Tax=Polymorphobacter sp. PAMC 29334 TaxID=2862331 RepID=UPI001C671CAE|nr:DUF3597 domain-containing protein [Polymorphobacter sp. PAMC 29334]QYE33360.1 DUF3597 domain-containing protein [Polymorphobacter sp. PAMC 29334]